MVVAPSKENVLYERREVYGVEVAVADACSLPELPGGRARRIAYECKG